MLKNKIVFICGLHRSGTTTLAKLLDKHPEISGFSGTGAIMDEGQFLQDVYLNDSYYGGVGLFGFHPSANSKELDEKEAAQVQIRLMEQWSKYWDLSKPILTEKTPSNLLKMRWLQSVFPNAKFIIITRHPIASSLASQKFAPIPVAPIVSHWVHCHKIAMDDIKHLNFAKTIKFEDLVANTDTIMTELQEFIGVSETVHIPSDFSDSNIKYFQQWEQHGKQYRKGLSILFSKFRFNKTLKRFGYSFEAPYYCEIKQEDASPPTSVKVLYPYTWRVERKLYKYLYKLGF